MFDLTPQLSADYDMANWYTSTHADSLFTHVLIAERLTAEVRRNLVNTWLTEKWRDGRVSERTLASAVELGQVLDELFGIDPPEPVGRLFARMTSAVEVVPEAEASSG